MIRTPLKSTDPLWFKDAVFYELHVRSFFDSNADGIGDFQGLIQKLDYLEELGIDAIWLLPFYPSPLRDDGYDVTDHYDIHADYGTLGDFKAFLKEAHRRGIRVVTELILNHTSDQHPWFKKARKSKAGSRYRDFYVWSDTPDKYKDARVIFPSEEASNWTYDEEAKAFYWHRYYHHQPELNYENPAVQLEMIKVADFWLKMGVDGFRLPSVTFLYEEEGTGCENLPQTHAFLRKLRAHIDKQYRHRILIAEANLWPEDAATYFGDGHECHMNFHYPLMPRLFLALRTEDSYPIIDIIDQTPPTPPAGQWALFLRNHDELGLEMVSEEEKDFLFKAYAPDDKTKINVGIRRRLAPLMTNDRRKIELMHMLLFSLPGTPVLYYGDEIGMGDNVYLGDRFGVRTPMQWNMNLNAGFSSANPQSLFLPIIQDPVYRHETVNVANHEANASSLLWWMKSVINMRKRLGVFGRGKISFIESNNAKVLAFSRSLEEQVIICVANLSQFAQATVLTLTDFKDNDITEVFSQNRFFRASGNDYALTLGPYGYFWFQADSEKREKTEASGELAVMKTSVSWERIFENYHEMRILERKVLPLFMKKCRWFGGKAKVISKATVVETIPVKVETDTHFLLVIEVQYTQRLPELYFLPVCFVPPDAMDERVEYTVQSVICRAIIQGSEGFIMDSSYDRQFRDFLFINMVKGSRLKDDDNGMLEFNSGVFVKPDLDKVESKILKADQSNTAIIYGDQYFFKFYRKIEREINPDLEIIRFLTENTNFQYSPRFAGSVQHRDKHDNRIVFGLLQEKVDNKGDAWVMVMDAIGHYYDRIIKKGNYIVFPALLEKPALRFEETPQLIQELIGRDFYELVVLLGRRTAEMHKALASDADASFAPENITPHYQRSLYASLRKLLKDRFSLLEDLLSSLDPQTRSRASAVLELTGPILESFADMFRTKISAVKTRIHGDYHLGQVLFTGKDFIIIDFEGEPGLSFNERRSKKSPFKDVAGMMRSFHYAAYGKILLNDKYSAYNADLLEQAAEQWQHYVSRYFLGSYMEHSGLGTNLSKENRTLIRTFLLEKAIYELGYELNARPDWVNVPLKGIHYLVNRYIQEAGLEPHR